MANHPRIKLWQALLKTPVAQVPFRKVMSNLRDAIINDDKWWELEGWGTFKRIVKDGGWRRVTNEWVARYGEDTLITLHKPRRENTSSFRISEPTNGYTISVGSNDNNTTVWDAVPGYPPRPTSIIRAGTAMLIDQTNTKSWRFFNLSNVRTLMRVQRWDDASQTTFSTFDSIWFPNHNAHIVNAPGTTNPVKVQRATDTPGNYPTGQGWHSYGVEDGTFFNDVETAVLPPAKLIIPGIFDQVTNGASGVDWAYGTNYPPSGNNF